RTGGRSPAWPRRSGYALPTAPCRRFSSRSPRVLTLIAAQHLVARLVSGAGAALLSVVLSAMVMARFAGPALAPAMGGFLAAYPFGIALTLLTLPALAVTAMSWRVAMLAAAAGCAFVLVATPFILAAGRPGPVSGAGAHAGGAQCWRLAQLGPS
ncbi:hypothetical protein, partial [Roseicella aerolata]